MNINSSRDLPKEKISHAQKIEINIGCQLNKDINLEKGTKTDKINRKIWHGDKSAARENEPSMT